jgi:Flp pilus assembly protein TadG
MAANALPTFGARRLFRRFANNRVGSAAIQFAMVAPLFFLIIGAIMETALVFFAGQILETGTRDTARTLLTHQAQDSSETAADFKTALCNSVSALLSCSGIALDVRSYDPTQTIALYNPTLDANGQFILNTQYNPPSAGASSIVVVRAFYQWPLVITGLGYDLTNIGKSSRLLAATAVFRVEP